jgi:calcineurin-like phosphoesterase
MVKILFFGDLVGQQSVELLSRNLKQLKLKHHADIVIANGENAFYGKGIDEDTGRAEKIERISYTEAELNEAKWQN